MDTVRQRIVGVHGVGNYRPGESARDASAQLAGVWSAALGREVGVAYYADLLHTARRQGGPLDLSQLDAYENELLAEWLGELPLPDAVAQGRVTWAPRQTVSWIARTRFPGKPATEWFVATFVREVATYLRSTGAERRAIRERVARTLAERRADVVIAHSLGSVVAYETLWQHPELRVSTLITLGSPLALPHAVFDRLDPSPVNARGARPPAVRRWINLADAGDIVAIPPHGVGRRFARVDVDEHTVIHAFDFHRVKNYLAAERVRRALHEGC